MKTKVGSLYLANSSNKLRKVLFFYGKLFLFLPIKLSKQTLSTFDFSCQLNLFDVKVPIVYKSPFLKVSYKIFKTEKVY